jgi:uncharacterized membrane protein YphA (DoxX/SURF4 family)
MDGIGEAWFGISTARSRDIVLVSCSRSFGLWGADGKPNVSWGNYARFVGYTAKLNSFFPAQVIPVLAMISTAAEIIFGILLILGWRTRVTALLSAILLIAFAVAMTKSWG